MCASTQCGSPRLTHSTPSSARLHGSFLALASGCARWFCPPPTQGASPAGLIRFRGGPSLSDFRPLRFTSGPLPAPSASPDGRQSELSLEHFCGGASCSGPSGFRTRPGFPTATTVSARVPSTEPSSPTAAALLAPRPCPPPRLCRPPAPLAFGGQSCEDGTFLPLFEAQACGSVSLANSPTPISDDHTSCETPTPPSSPPPGSFLQGLHHGSSARCRAPTHARTTLSDGYPPPDEARGTHATNFATAYPTAPMYSGHKPSIYMNSGTNYLSQMATEGSSWGVSVGGERGGEGGRERGRLRWGVTWNGAPAMRA